MNSSRPATSRLYHNTRCSKSRASLELLQARGVTPELVYYLETPPDAAELHWLLGLLGLPARSLLRSSEAKFAELGLDDPSLDEGAVIAAMAAHPQLIERPVFVHGDRAVIGRPPERVLELLD